MYTHRKLEITRALESEDVHTQAAAPDGTGGAAGNKGTE